VSGDDGRLTEAPPASSEGAVVAPFASARVREATPVGRRLVWLVERDGEPPFMRTVHFVDCGDERAVIARSMADLEGRSIGEVTTRGETWDEVLAPGVYDAARTEVTRGVSVEVPAGAWVCARFRVEEPEDGAITEAFYADALPGPPVQLVRTIGDKVVMRMTLVRLDHGGAADDDDDL
jgi:hypothetical protein